MVLVLGIMGHEWGPLQIGIDQGAAAEQLPRLPCGATALCHVALTLPLPGVDVLLHVLLHGILHGILEVGEG